MLKVDQFGRIQRAHRDGMSIREISRRFGHSRKTVRKSLAYAAPPEYTRRQPAERPKLTAVFRDHIEQILKDDESQPRKQRHTAKRIFERLQNRAIRAVMTKSVVCGIPSPTDS